MSFLRVGWWSLLLAVLSLPAAAGLSLNGTEARVDLASACEVWEDKSASLDVEAVTRQSFVPVTQRMLHPGYTASAIWLKCSVASTAGAPLLRWLSVRSTRLREVALFLPEGDRWQRMDAGTATPLAQHPIRTRGAVFPVSLQPGQGIGFYLRIASTTTIGIVPVLWDPFAFYEAESDERIRSGLLLGATGLTAVFSFLMFLALKNRAFLLFGASICCNAIYESAIRGYAFIYLWPDATDWATRAIGVSTLVATALLLPFARDLFQTRTRLPRWDRALAYSLLAVPGLLAGQLFGDYRFWVRWATVAVLAILAIQGATGVIAVRNRLPAARFYAAAFIVVLLDALLRMLNIFGLFRTGISVDYDSVVMLISYVLLLAAVVDRIMQAKAEKEAALKTLNETLEAHEARLESAVKDRTADLDAALTEVRSAHQNQSQLLAYISHDLRTPLATIINYIHLLGTHVDNDARKYQDTIERSALHQMELIDELVEYSRGELNRLELHPAPTYLHAWLEDIAGQAELLARQYGNRLVVDVGELPPVAVFDPKRLRQVLLNLLVNAAKFTANGEIRLRVYGDSAAGSGAVRLSCAVEDNGPGIPQADIERIFEPFERVESSRPGSGLGLSIARHIVRGMGGELRLVSDPGRGSRFSFELQLPLADEADVQHPMHAFAMPESFGTGKHVLVADDNPATRDYLSEVLISADFDVVDAPDGAEALRLACERPFDLVLADQMMPRLDGWGLLRGMHERLGPRMPPVVLCSAIPPQRPDGFPTDVHFAASLLKPVAGEKLLQTAMTLLIPAPRDDDAGGVSVADGSLADLREMVAMGNITEIEEWAATFESRHPEHAGFARRVGDAARNVDLAELSRLVEVSSI